MNKKHLNLGKYEVVVSILVFAIILIINVLIAQFPWQYDGTEQEKYSLNDQTISILKELKNDTRIYALYRDKNQLSELKNLLDVYTSYSPKLFVEFIDPDVNPVLINSFDTDNQGIPYGSLIVANDERFDLIMPNDLFLISYGQDGSPSIIGSQMEQQITSSLYTIHQDWTPKIYQILEHGEKDIRSLPMYETLTMQNYEIVDYSLFNKNIPQEKSIITILSPRDDFTELEVEILEDYLTGGGRVIITIDYIGREYPNLVNMLENFGLTLDYGFVLDSDSRRNAGDYLLIVPEVMEHKITQGIISQNMNIVVPLALGISRVSTATDFTMTPLLQSSSSSWLRFDLSEQNFEYNENTDTRGPISLAWAVEKNHYVQSETDNDFRLLVTGSGNMFESIQGLGVVKANMNFLIDGINWVQQNSDDSSVPPRFLPDQNLSLTSFHIIMYSLLLIIMFPLIIAGLGVIVWLRRRNL